MNIRGDLKNVENLITRMILIGNEFAKKDSEWSHLRNKENFDNIYKITDHSKRSKLERIYADGRDMALFMSEALQSINTDFTEYPTLNAIVEKFESTWVYNDLRPIIEEARITAAELHFDNWAFNRMLSTFEDQVKLLQAISQTLEVLKKSDLYKQENGEEMPRQNHSIKIENVANSNITLNSSHVSQSISVENEIFNKIIEAIEASCITNKEELILATKSMEAESKSGSIAKSYKNFMSLASDHVTVFTPFLAALATLL